MCGRYELDADAIDYGRLGIAHTIIDAPLRTNIAPTQSVLIVREHEGARELASAKWGLIPSWSKDDKNGAKCFNARCETAAEKPSFGGP